MSLPPLTFNAWLRYPLIKRFIADAVPPQASILEVGMGQGALGVRLSRRYRYVGVEMDPVSHNRAAARMARFGQGHALLGEVSAIPEGSRFDVVCAFEVLEHIEDDAGALRRWGEFIERGGLLVLSVPAFQRRFGPADRAAGHFRRYEPNSIAALLRSTGFTDVVVRTYGVPLGYVLEWARNVIASRREHSASLAESTARSGRHLQPPASAGFITASITAPFRLMQRPFLGSGRGTGLVVAARRDA
ncbi:MAG TPA: class I SAM-dependent methyltransferase [Actinomycetota bacterium]|nr:class I SAM-dependent methyltransferase [Actinomycetota bacterium]